MGGILAIAVFKYRIIFSDSCRLKRKSLTLQISCFIMHGSFKFVISDDRDGIA